MKKPPGALHLIDTTIRTHRPDGTLTLETPLIHHSIEAQTSTGFHDPQRGYGEAPFRHTFTVTLPIEGEDPEEERHLVNQLSAAQFEIKSAPAGYDHTLEVIVATTEIQQFPSRFQEGDDTVWSEWLDSIDSDLSWVGCIADRIRDRSENGELLSGGHLFYISKLNVHPRFRGQKIGLRLLAHALLAVSHSTHDVTILIATDLPGLWDPRPREQTRKRAQSLARYYQQLGFRETESAEGRRLIAMYLPGGPSELPIAQDLPR